MFLNLANIPDITNMCVEEADIVIGHVSNDIDLAIQKLTELRNIKDKAKMIVDSFSTKE